jgi:hypothetical protein
LGSKSVVCAQGRGYMLKVWYVLKGVGICAQSVMCAQGRGYVFRGVVCVQGRGYMGSKCDMCSRARVYVLRV